MDLLILPVALLICALFLRALLASPAARLFADPPDHRKVHQSPVPRFGGIGIILSFLSCIGLLVLLDSPLHPAPHGTQLGALVLIGLFLLVAGGWDDAKPLGYKVKFALQFVLAAAVVLMLGRDFDTIAILGHRFDLGGFGQLLSILWMVAVMNALNIIDGIDGLAAGVALCGFAAIAFMAHANGAEALTLLCLAIAGGILGFLRFNFSRRQKLFLGDAGSQFLGAMLALFTIEVQGMFKTGFSIWVPLFIVGYPLLDVSVAMIRRFRCGYRRAKLGGRIIRMFVADNEHLHHRLVYLGLSHAQSTFLLLLLAGGIGATAIIISRLGWPHKPLVMAYLGVAVLLILNRLGYIGIQPWLTFPRAKAKPARLVGVIEPDEVFLHSLKSFEQQKFEFLSIPEKLTQFISDELMAVLLYNATSDRFEEQWTKALRAVEVQECPAVVIADARDIECVRSKNPAGYPSIHFVEKPVRVPELIRLLEGLSSRDVRPVAPRDRRFSLAELVLRSRQDAG